MLQAAGPPLGPLLMSDGDYAVALEPTLVLGVGVWFMTLMVGYYEPWVWGHRMFS